MNKIISRRNIFQTREQSVHREPSWAEIAKFESIGSVFIWSFFTNFAFLVKSILTSNMIRPVAAIYPVGGLWPSIK